MSEYVSEQQAAGGRDWLRIVSLALSVVGLFIAGYLAYAEVFAGVETMACPSDGAELFGIPIDCGTVNLSRFATVGPIPVSLLGLAGYIMILGVLLLEDRLALLREYGALLFFGLTLFGIAFSAYLTWAEIFEIRAFCTWCLGSAAVMLVLFVIAIIRLVRHLNADTFEDVDVDVGVDADHD